LAAVFPLILAALAAVLPPFFHGRLFCRRFPRPSFLPTFGRRFGRRFAAVFHGGHFCRRLAADLQPPPFSTAVIFADVFHGRRLAAFAVFLKKTPLCQTF
jgi:hypothetical protein